jgi:Bardet-Biedl syndrome 7 protein
LNSQQKLVTGDDSGHVGCYEFKKGAPQTVFLTRVFDGPISCVAIGGNVQKKDKVRNLSAWSKAFSDMKTDLYYIRRKSTLIIILYFHNNLKYLQIFAAHSQRIIGLTKKGKEFFKLTSSLTESIRNIAVEDTKIWTGCEYIYNLYDNGQDTAFFMCRDQINALTVEHITRDTDYDAVLACQDKCLRIVQGSTLVVEIPTLAPATAIASKGTDYFSLSFAVLNFCFFSGQSLCLRESLFVFFR